MDYRPILDIEVLDFMAVLKAAQRERLVAHFQLIQSDARNYAKNIERDQVGRLRTSTQKWDVNE